MSKITWSGVTENLYEQKWYWNEADREKILEVLSDRVDGSFIVRRSSTPGWFTLSVKCFGAVKLMHIIIKNERCGFHPDSLHFLSVVDLIMYYQQNSLKSYNKLMDIQLYFPVAKDGRYDVTYDLYKQDWYWENEEKEYIWQELICKPDGSFIVRNSRPPTPFTLSIKCDGKVRHLHIVVRDNKCGFDFDSLYYDTVVWLIEFYQKCSLKTYSSLLDVVLINPVSRASRAVNWIMKAGQLEEKKMLDADNDLDWKNACHSEGLRMNQLSSIRKFKLFNLNQYSIERAQGQIKNLALHAQGLAKEIHKKQAEIVLSVEQQATSSEQIDELTEQKMLLEKEINQEIKPNADSILTQVVACESTNLTKLLVDLELNWTPVEYMMRRSSRQSAERILDLALNKIKSQDIKLNGAIFLIRESVTQPGKFYLTAFFEKQVFHVPINQNEAGWGFLHKLHFTSIPDFVRYYSHHPLNTHLEGYNFLLQIPAFEMSLIETSKEEQPSPTSFLNPNFLDDSISIQTDTTSLNSFLPDDPRDTDWTCWPEAQ
uniref:SH2 domain-containing protein n=1 Tax=Caenorhabditis tropicalis TaxID=1561998 RepID=A0A1I7TLM8_9PELO